MNVNSKLQHNGRPRPFGSGGFTLVEIMVALVVLAVGLLGIAGLYIESLRSGQMSVSYTNAVELAASMADRIRSNSTARANYIAVAAGNGTGGTNANNCVNGIANCTPTQLAADDWYWWYEDVKVLMPEGRQASIQHVAVFPVDVYTINIQWPERGQAQPVGYTLSFSR